MKESDLFLENRLFQNFFTPNRKDWFLKIITKMKMNCPILRALKMVMKISSVGFGSLFLQFTNSTILMLRLAMR